MEERGPHAPGVSEPSHPAETDELAQGLQKRDGRFILRLALRFGVVVLFVVWLFLSQSGSNLANWAADGFGSLTAP